MWIDLLISLWASIVITIYWIEILRMPEKYQWLNWKPINCEVCLPVWLLITIFPVVLLFRNLVGIVACSLTAGIITGWLLKKMRQ